MVIAAALGLFEFADLKRIFRMQQWEFWLSFTCFVGVAVFGAIPGICIAVAISVIEFLWDAGARISRCLAVSTAPVATMM